MKLSTADADRLVAFHKKAAELASDHAAAAQEGGFIRVAAKFFQECADAARLGLKAADLTPVALELVTRDPAADADAA